MPTLVVPANVALCHIDDFPAGCARSRPGSLSVRPASTVTLTDDELAHLKRRHPDLVQQLIEVRATPSLQTQLKGRLAKDAELSKRLADREKAGKARKAAEAQASAKPETEMEAKQRARMAAKAAARSAGEQPGSARKPPAPAPNAPAEQPKTEDKSKGK